VAKRILIFTAVVVALAVPAISFADSGTPAGNDGSKVTARIDAMTARLNDRFSKFSARCLIANAPKNCSRVANRVARRMDRAQNRLNRIEARITKRCAKATPPAICANAGSITAKIDSLVSTLTADVAAIKAAYPNAG
jgi:hypothetical protein